MNAELVFRGPRSKSVNVPNSPDLAMKTGRWKHRRMLGRTCLRGQAPTSHSNSYWFLDGFFDADIKLERMRFVVSMPRLSYRNN